MELKILKNKKAISAILMVFVISLIFIALFLQFQKIMAATLCGDNDNGCLMDPYDECDFNEEACMEEYDTWELPAGNSTTDCWFEMCCGDDAGEYPRVETTYSEAIAFNNGQRACCDGSTDCVAGTTCYNSAAAGTSYGSLNSGGNDNYSHCYNSSGVGKWLECDQSDYMDYWCGNVCGPKKGVKDPRTSGVPDANWNAVASGMTVAHGEYIPGTVLECCGDDVNEAYVYRNCDNSYACADSLSDDACCNSTSYCVSSGVCYSIGGTADVDGNGDVEQCLYAASALWFDCANTDHCDPVGEYAYTETSNTCVSGECSEACTSSDCIYQRYAGNGDCDNNDGCYSSNCIQDTNYATTFVSTGMCDNNVGAICTGGASDGYDVCVAAGSCLIDHDRDDAMGDCTGSNCIIEDLGTFDVDGDGDLDMCNLGVWIDCTLDTHCGTCQSCISNNCVNATPPNDPKNECGTTGCGTGYCNGSGACAYNTSGQHNCLACYECNASGNCIFVTDGTDPYDDCALCYACDQTRDECYYAESGTDVKDECGTTGCGIGTCNGAGTCGLHISGQQNCGTCKGCNASGVCTDVTIGTDPWDSCGICGICDQGSCGGYAGSGTDPEDECSEGSWSSCSGQCIRLKDSGNCAGGASCGVNDEPGNIETGYVCAGAGVQTAVSSSNNCLYWENCDAGDCSATKYYNSCNGSGSCRSSGDTTNAATQAVYPDHAYSLTDACGITGTTLCSGTDHCVGSTRYTGWICNDVGGCVVASGAIGCCTDSYCSAYVSCDQSSTSTTPYQCDTCWTLTKGTFDSTQRNSGDPSAGDMCYNVNLSSTVNTCLMYNIGDTEEDTEDAKIYIGKTYFSDTVASGDNAWAYYKWHDISSNVVVGNNLIEFDDNECCWWLDEVLIGYMQSERGSSADGSSSTSCCNSSTDCVDDYEMGSHGTSGDWGCYNSGVYHDADGDGDDDYCNSGDWKDCNVDADCIDDDCLGGFCGGTSMQFNNIKMQEIKIY